MLIPIVSYLGLSVMCYNNNTWALPLPMRFSSLQEVFGDKGKSARQVALRTVMNTKITERTPLRDYMIHMIILFNKIKIFRAKIDGET